MTPYREKRHIGAGSGYYTAILAMLVGPAGTVAAADVSAHASRGHRGHAAPHAQIWRAYDAAFVSSAMFIPCIGGREDETAQKLTAAFQSGGTEAVTSLYRNKPVDDSCWFAGNGWWLSYGAR